MIFVDASALIAIIVGESDADILANRLEADRERICSAISIWETVAGLCHSHTFSPPMARDHVGRFLETANIKFVSIGEREFAIALDAYSQFGKGRHSAALNMGDCFAYACAKANGAALLFKGADFPKTDVGAFGH
jgi:ribonuclease VapC